MILNHIKQNLIVVYAIILHLVWAVSLWASPTTANATAVHTLLQFLSIPQAIAVYLSVACLAIIGLIYRENLWKPLFLLPQQFVLIVSAGGALWAMWIGQFADGIQRSHEFLIADQSPAVIAALLHTYAICLIIKETRYNDT